MVTKPERFVEIVAARLEKLAPDPQSKKRLADASGVPSSSFQRMLKGANEPAASALKRIAEAANVSLDWLTGLTDEREVTWAGTPALVHGGVRGGVPEGFVAVPALEIQASAGSGSLSGPTDMDSAEIVAFREAWLRSLGFIPGRVHILWATGDSMEPTIRDGAMMLVDRTIDRVVHDGIYVVVAAGAVRVKRVSLRQSGGVVLRSDNERYPEELIPADEVPQMTIEGRVRWVGGPI